MNKTSKYTAGLLLYLLRVKDGINAAIEYISATHGGKEELSEALKEFFTFFEKEDSAAPQFWSSCLQNFPEAQKVVYELLRSDSSKLYELYILSFAYQTREDPTAHPPREQKDYRHTLEEALDLLLREKPIAGISKEARERTMNALTYVLIKNPEDFKLMIPHSKTLREIMPTIYGQVYKEISFACKTHEFKKAISDIFDHHLHIGMTGEIPPLLKEEALYSPGFLCAFLEVYLPKSNPSKDRAGKVVQRIGAYFNWGGNKGNGEAAHFRKEISDIWKNQFEEDLPTSVLPEGEELLGWASKWRNW